MFPVIPQIWVLSFFFQLAEFGFLFRKVKDAPEGSGVFHKPL
jgi:hypothetical protein